MASRCEQSFLLEAAGIELRSRRPNRRGSQAIDGLLIDDAFQSIIQTNYFDNGSCNFFACCACVSSFSISKYRPQHRSRPGIPHTCKSPLKNNTGQPSNVPRILQRSLHNRSHGTKPATTAGKARNASTARKKIARAIVEIVGVDYRLKGIIDQ